jgi:hypothetical protein
MLGPRFKRATGSSPLTLSESFCAQTLVIDGRFQRQLTGPTAGNQGTIRVRAFRKYYPTQLQWDQSFHVLRATWIDYHGYIPIYILPLNKKQRPRPETNTLDND